MNLSCFFSGVAHTPIAHAEFVSALTPLVLIPVAAVTLGERVPRRAVAAGAVALTGVALVLGQTPAGGTSYLGDLLVLGAMGAWVVHLMTARTTRARLATTDFMAVMSTAACLTTLVIALAAGRGRDLLGLTPRGWLFVVLLAITAGVVSPGLIAWSQRRVAVSTIAMLQLAQPGLGVLWAATYLGGSVTPVQLLGMAIVLAAVGAIARASAGQPDGAGVVQTALDIAQQLLELSGLVRRQVLQDRRALSRCSGAAPSMTVRPAAVGGRARPPSAGDLTRRTNPRCASRSMRFVTAPEVIISAASRSPAVSSNGAPVRPAPPGRRTPTPRSRAGRTPPSTVGRCRG